MLLRQRAAPACCACAVCGSGLCGVQDVGAADRLFATVDTKIRRAATLHGRSFLLVDTVGFIQGLPLQLVAAFQATLDEALEADLVVSPNFTSQFDCMVARGLADMLLLLA